VKKTTVVRKWLIICLLVSIVVVLFNVYWRRLNREQTIGAIVAIPAPRFVSRAICRRADAEARGELYQILGNPDLHQFHHNAFRVLGYIGDRSDVDRILSFVSKQSGKSLSDEEEDVLESAVDALGVLGRRGYSEATNALRRMSQPEYASQIRLAMHDDYDLRDAGGLTSELEFIVWCFKARTMAGEDVSAEAAVIVKTIDHDQLRRTMIYRSASSGMKQTCWEIYLSEFLPVARGNRRHFEEAYRKRFATDADTKDNLAVAVELTDPEVDRLIAIGDASVVPLLRGRLDAQLSLPAGQRSLRFALAVQGLAAFQDDTHFQPLRAAYESTGTSVTDRSVCASYLARNATADHVALMQEIMGDEAVSSHSRWEAAYSLWRLSEPTGGQFLLQQYDLYRVEARTRSIQHLAGARTKLATIYDGKIIEELLERIPAEPDQRLKNNIQTLVNRMRMNNEPIDRLKECAADASWKNASKRYEAIEVLGQKATPELVPFLESLAPFTGDNVPPLQEHVFHEEVSAAIGHIRRSHWKEN
jgi:hypothetical protein